MDFTENRTMIGILAIVLVLFAVAVFFYSQTLNQLASGSCTESAATCPHEKVVETQNVVIAALILVIFTVVGWIFYQMYWKKPSAQAGRAAQPAGREQKKIDVSTLDGDEKKVLEIVQEGGGSAFQSDIIKKLGYSKVKVSRMLDRMEQKGLVERKRRGMANLVVLR